MPDPEIARRCSVCGASVRNRAMFCPQCGQKVESQPQVTQTEDDSRETVAEGGDPQIEAGPGEEHLDTQVDPVTPADVPHEIVEAEAAEVAEESRDTQAAETREASPPVSSRETQIELSLPTDNHDPYNEPQPAPGTRDTQVELALPTFFAAPKTTPLKPVSETVSTAETAPTQALHTVAVDQPSIEAHAVGKVGKLKRVSSVVLDQAAYDPSTRFLLVAGVLFVLFLVLLLMSKVIG